MTVSWTFGGTALTSFGKVTLMDDYIGTATRRGGNQIIPFRNGDIFASKYFEGRKFTFGMAITAASATALETTFDNMRKLFGVRTEQVLAMTMEDSSVRNISATVNDPIQVSRKTATLALVVVKFDCAAAVWRLSTAIADNTTVINTNPKAMTVTNPGTVAERNATITLTGTLTNTVITNSTTGETLTYTGTITSPRVVTISVNAYGEYIATDDLGANVIGNITHTGSTALMTFNPGANTLSVADASGAGTVKVAFNAPFL